MPLLPIDLQTMFAHMNQVGREQAIQKQVSPEAQSLQASNIVKRTEEKDNSVNETNEIGEGPEQVKEEEERESGKQQAEERKDSRSGTEKTDREIFRDPSLGQHIDITG